MKLESIRAFVADLSKIWSARRPARLAAALAYYAMFSLAPMLYVAITVAGTFVNEAAIVDRLVAEVADNLGPEMVQFIQDMVAGAALTASGGSPLATLISAGALLYGATGLFSQLQYALNAIWDVPPAAYAGTIAAIKNRLLAFVMVLGLSLLLILATFASVLVSLLGSWFGWTASAPIATQVVFVGLLTVTLVLIYKVVPDERDRLARRLGRRGSHGIAPCGRQMGDRFLSKTQRGSDRLSGGRCAGDATHRHLLPGPDLFVWRGLDQGLCLAFWFKTRGVTRGNRLAVIPKRWGPDVRQSTKFNSESRTFRQYPNPA